MAPVADYAKGIIKLFFADSIKAAREDIDGELIVFIVLDVALVFIFSQLKTAFARYEEEVDKKIVEEKEKEEEAFNKGLKNELQRNIASYTNYMVGILLKAAPLVADAMQVYGAETIDTEKVEAQAKAKFVEAIKTLPGIKISQEGKVIVVTSSKFGNIDKVLATIQNTVFQLKKEFRTAKVVIKTRLAIDTYKPLTPPKKVFELVKPLLTLNSGNDFLCYGNFKNRYAMNENQEYGVYVKGKYDIADLEETIWMLVKKV